MKNSKHSTSFFTILAIIGILFAINACSSQFAVRGNLPDADRLAEVIPDEVHARDVAEILGTPSSFSSFGGESWYYISERTESFLFFEPEIIERVVVEVQFDQTGMVKAVHQDQNASIRNVEFVDRTTPTAGNEITFFEQIFGNIGRFNPGE